MTEWMGRVPEAGEAMERDGIRIEVLAANELRVDQVRISKAQPVTGNGIRKRLRFGLRLDHRPAERRQIDAAECAGRDQGRDRRGQTADDAHRDSGRLERPGAQVVFLDTPGIHQSDTLINRRMMGRSARHWMNAICCSIWPMRPADSEKRMRRAIDMLRKTATPAIPRVNKIDGWMTSASCCRGSRSIGRSYPFGEYIPVSAMTGEGLDVLTREVVKRMPAEGRPTSRPIRSRTSRSAFSRPK